MINSVYDRRRLSFVNTLAGTVGNANGGNQSSIHSASSCYRKANRSRWSLAQIVVLLELSLLFYSQLDNFTVNTWISRIYSEAVNQKVESLDESCMTNLALLVVLKKIMCVTSRMSWPPSSPPPSQCVTWARPPPPKCVTYYVNAPSLKNPPPCRPPPLKKFSAPFLKS